MNKISGFWTLLMCVLLIGNISAFSTPEAGVVYTIVAPKKANRVLSLKNNKTNNGNTATLVRKSQAKPKAIRWKLTEAPGKDFFYIENQASGLVLAPYSQGKGASWVLKPKRSGNRVKLIRQKGGTYRIQFRTTKNLYLGLDKSQRLKNLTATEALDWTFKREAVQTTSGQVGNTGIGNTNLGGGIDNTNTGQVANLAKFTRGELFEMGRRMFRIKANNGMYLASSEMNMNKPQDGKRIITRRLNEEARNGYAFEWKPTMHDDKYLSFHITGEGQWDFFLTENNTKSEFKLGTGGVLNKSGKRQQFELTKVAGGKLAIAIKNDQGRKLYLTQKPSGQTRFESYRNNAAQHWEFVPVLKRDFRVELVHFKILEESDPGSELEIRQAELNVIQKGLGSYPRKLLVYKQPQSTIGYEVGETYPIRSQGLKIVEKRFEERNKKARIEMEVQFTFKEQDRLKLITRPNDPDYVYQDFVGRSMITVRPTNWVTQPGSEFKHDKLVIVRDGGNVIELRLAVIEKVVYPASEPVDWRTYRDYFK